MSIKNLSIRAKVMAVATVVLLLTCGMGAIAVTRLGVISGFSTSMASEQIPAIDAAAGLQGRVAHYRSERLKLTLADGASDAAQAPFAKATADVEQQHTRLAALPASPQAKALLDQFQAQWKAEREISEEVKRLAKSNDQAGLRTLFAGPADKAQAATDDTLRKLIDTSTESATAAGAAAAAELGVARIGISSYLGMMLIVGLWFAWYVARGLSHAARDAVAQANLIAAGDLSHTVTVDRRDEMGQILESLNKMQASLRGIVTGVRQNAEGVATASAEISAGNNDLSARTEQQASALEETAASMEELGSTVKQNADNARQANQLAMSTSTVAVSGGEVVDRVVETMKGINDSSRRIADIIGTIDGIAFQTNILALNAAVEAARAGEQGRGFAVVASEVRSLAQRSAEAAKEIKSLISTSVERVEQGTALVDQAGATMQEVVASIKRVTDIMGEISAASTEQSAGVAQVGEAVTQMDQATQQNAALVEESAAAAESLKGQARKLVDAVAVFKLNSTDGARAAAPVVAPAPVTHKPVMAAKPMAHKPLDVKPEPKPVAAKPVVAPSAPAATPAPAPAPVATTAKAAADDDWETF